MKMIIFILILLSIFCLMGFEIEPVSNFCDSYIYRSANMNFIEFEGKLFILSLRALSVFDIEDGGFELISEINIPGDGYKLDHVNDIFYVVTCVDQDFFRIDYSDILNPVITDSIINMSGSHSFFCNDDKIYINEYNYQDYLVSLHIYDSDTFEELAFIVEPICYLDLDPVKENIGYSRDINDNLVFYDITDYNNMIELGNLPWPNIISPMYRGIFQDSIFVMNVLEGILFIDISDLENPSVIDTLETRERHFHINGSDLITFGSETKLSVYDISDINNITLKQHFNYPNFKGYANCETYEDRMFISQMYGEIDIYENNGNEYNLTDSFKSHGGLYFGFTLNDNCYIGSYKNGLLKWDLTDINNPLLGSSYQPNNNYSDYSSYQEKKICGLTYNEERCQVENEILEIQNDGSILKRYSVDYDVNDNSLFCAGSGDHIFNIEDECFQRILLNEDNELIVENSVSLLQYASPIPTVIGDWAFLSTTFQTTIIENVYGDFDENDITVIPGYFTSYDEIHCFGDYIFISTEADDLFDTTILKYDENEGFQYFTTMENSGVIAIDEENELLFVSYVDCTVYDLSIISSNVLPEVFTFDQLGYCEDMSLFEKDGDLYMFYLQLCDAEILVYDPDVSDNTNDEIMSLSAKISNHPNPFILGSSTRSSSTEICLNLSDPKGKYFVDIFNIKGQHIRSIDVDNSSLKNDVRVNWDGTNQHGQKVGSGVYLIGLNNGSEIIASKKCMVLK